MDELRSYISKSVNVIDYDKSEIIFHGTLEYNESGKAYRTTKRFVEKMLLV